MMNIKSVWGSIAYAILIVVAWFATSVGVANGVEHPGLLGKRYVDFRFGVTDYLDSPNLSNGTRFQLEFNSPIWKHAEWGVDVYAEVATGRESANYSSDFFWAKSEFDVTSASVGATFYLDGSWVRPFVQFGLSYDHIQWTFDSFFSGGYSTLRGYSFRQSAVQSADDFRTDLRVGYELDVRENTAWRTSLALDVEGSLSNSFLSSELIIRPLDRGFLRVGLGTDLETDYVAGLFGIGFEF